MGFIFELSAKFGVGRLKLGGLGVYIPRDQGSMHMVKFVFDFSVQVIPPTRYLDVFNVCTSIEYPVLSIRAIRAPTNLRIFVLLIIITRYVRTCNKMYTNCE